MHRDDYLVCRKEWGFDDILSYGKGTILLFSGPSGTGKTMLAHALAKATTHRLMLVDYRVFQDEAGFSRAVPLAEIRAHDGNLSIPLYISLAAESATGSCDASRPDLAAALGAWLESSARVREALAAVIDRGGDGPPS
jgi:energy-coupling factor transporter ATP-binding protein EcfA2